MAHMLFSRRGRLDERKQKKRLFVGLAGTIALLIFLGVFGVKMIVGLSLLVDTMRGSTPPPATPSQNVILPPTLDPEPIATKSAGFKISGIGQEGLTIILYVNDKEAKKIQVDKTGTFSITLPDIKEGQNTISAKLADAKGNFSDLSNVLSVLIINTPPILELQTPSDNATVNGENNLVTVEGKTEDDTSVNINGRLVVIKTDNTFSYQYPLNDGDNKLTIIATDLAGNATKIERNVTYQK